MLSEARRKVAAGFGVLFVALVVVVAVVIPYRPILVEGPVVEIRDADTDADIAHLADRCRALGADVVVTPTAVAADSPEPVGGPAGAAAGSGCGRFFFFESR